MARAALKEKFGVVLILDALGASAFTPTQIKTFLATRADVNDIIKKFAKQLPEEAELAAPVIFTFGDTLILTVSIDLSANVQKQIMCVILLMRRYLFHSLLKGVLFRGSFSIGHYIEDAKSNTVMGAAVADAAEWYERADWMGLCATPKTNTELEYHMDAAQLDMPVNLLKYPVPFKAGASMELYSISWPGAFFDKTLLKSTKESSPRKWFLSLLKDFVYPAAASSKYQNSKEFFLYVEARIANLASVNTDAAR